MKTFVIKKGDRYWRKNDQGYSFEFKDAKKFTKQEAQEIISRPNSDKTIHQIETLHLNLKKKWFDMIASGEKKEEYREIKDYWTSKFVAFLWTDNMRNKSHTDRLISGDYTRASFLDDFQTITFSNGYSKNRNQMIVEFLGIDVETGNPDWGADPDQKYFVLKLGNILSKNF